MTTAALKPRLRTPLEHSGFAVLRTPLLPVSVMQDWSGSLPASGRGDTDADFTLSVEKDREELTRRLLAVAENELVKAALHVASPHVAGLLENRARGHADEAGSERLTRLVSTLANYILRMAYRPTPFGLFAGVTTLAIQKRTELALPAAESYRQHSRLDIVYLAQVCNTLERDEEIRDRLRFRRSSGAYQVAGQVRLAEVETLEGGDEVRRFHLTSFDANAALCSVLDRAEGGATIDGLADFLVTEFPDLDRDDARGFVGQLVDEQLLISELEPNVTGPDAFDSIVERLSDLAPDVPAVELLQRVGKRLRRMGRGSVSASLADYRRASDELSQLPVPVPAKYLHVDLYKPASDAALGSGLVRAVRDGIQLMHGLCPTAARSDLSRFVAEFRERYGDSEVPFMQALDEDFGVGFGRAAPEQTELSPLLAGLDLAPRSSTTAEWKDRDARLLRLLDTALRQRQPAIALTQQDIDDLSTDDVRPLPDALAANVTVLAASAEAIDRGDYKLLWHGAFGPSGALYFGRFCHGDPHLLDCVRRHLQQEARHNPDAVYAEITHLPQTRIGNVICRPSLRSYEIPYHGGSGVPPDRRISVNDLRIRVQDDRVVLRSAALDCEVIPRLTTAHNAAQAELGPYRLLCALQTQGVCHWLNWDWGVLESATYLPRVEAGRLILARARWRLDEQMSASISGKDAGQLMRSVARLRTDLGLPRWVQVVQADRLLPLDLDNVICVESLRRYAVRQPVLDLTELLPAPDSLCVSAPEGRFNHELVIPFVRPATPAPSSARQVPASTPRFVPGSEWLYAKAYLGHSQAEQLLRTGIADFVRRERAQDSFDSWFFIRFADPDFHLRLRFRGEPGRLLGLWDRFRDSLQSAIDDGRIWRLQLDTYDPESDRYGGEQSIGLAEQCFEADSDAAIELLCLVEDDDSLRWQVTAMSVHRLFDDLAIPLPDRIRQLEAMRTQLLTEYDLGASANRLLAGKFRELRAIVESVLSPEHGDDLVAHARLVLDDRSRRLRPVGSELHRLSRAGLLSRSVDRIALSLAHMTANRLLRAAARAQELVLYDILIRSYNGALARSRSRSP